MRYVASLMLALAAGACGSYRLTYTDPERGALRLVTGPGSTPTAAVLDFVVGDHPVTGYATGLDLALDPTRVALGAFVPGHGLDPGQAPIAAGAVIPSDGPLAGMLVAAVSQKASGAGAIAGDTELAPGTVLFTVRLDLIHGPTPGVVFDGTADGFVLRSGGLRNKAGITVVEASDVGIGTLEVR